MLIYLSVAVSYSEQDKVRVPALICDTKFCMLLPSAGTVISPLLVVYQLYPRRSDGNEQLASTTRKEKRIKRVLFVFVVVFLCFVLFCFLLLFVCLFVCVFCFVFFVLFVCLFFDLVARVILLPRDLT